MFNLLPNSLRLVLTTFLFTANREPPPSSSITFQLRHQHAVANDSRVIFSNLDDLPTQALLTSTSRRTYSLNSRALRSHKPRSFDAHREARLQSLHHSKSTAQEELWDSPVDVPGPDVTDLDTLITLAEMTSNSYTEPEKKDWYDLGPDWNNSYPFGWEPDSTGTRGHIFVSTDNSTVVLSIKGTSVPLIGGGPTVPEDKLNDNLLFSCCCARVGPTWSTVCGCYKGGGKCDQDCLEKSLVEDSLFYTVGTNLYNNVSYIYPDANIWIIGHSLGGSLASLLGATFGAPVVAFEAPGERMAAKRLHLPSPPSTQHITHVYHNADPIPMGTCTGVSSACAIGGYALESKCHLGKTILYDTVNTLGWSSSVANHPISVVVDKMLNITGVHWNDTAPESSSSLVRGETSMGMLWWPWGPGKGKDGEEEPDKPNVPEAREEEDCVDCYQWEYI